MQRRYSDRRHSADVVLALFLAGLAILAAVLIGQAISTAFATVTDAIEEVGRG